MSKVVKYILIRKSKYHKYQQLNTYDSYNMNKKKDYESIGVIKIYDVKIIQRAIKKSIDLRFKKLLELIVSLEESDEDPSSGLLFCLDEADRFKHELINKYERFLKKKEMEFLNKKISLIEREVQNKLMEYRIMQNAMQKMMDEDMSLEEERHHSR